MDRNKPQSITEKTIADYNLIGEDFSSTRRFLAKDIHRYKKLVEDGDVILDFGCGNGILSELFTDLSISYLGVDNSKKMIEIAKKKHPNLRFELTTNIPIEYPDKSFDLVFSLSVLHHIFSYELRREYLSEFIRLLKDDGTIILTMWEPKDATIEKSEALGDGDYLVPYKNKDGEVMAERFIHIFNQNEVEKLAQDCGLTIIENEHIDRGMRGNKNLCVILEKEKNGK